MSTLRELAAFTSAHLAAAAGIEARDDQEYRWLRQAFTAGLNEAARYGALGVTP